MLAAVDEQRDRDAVQHEREGGQRDHGEQRRAAAPGEVGAASSDQEVAGARQGPRHRGDQGRDQAHHRTGGADDPGDAHGEGVVALDDRAHGAGDADDLCGEDEREEGPGERASSGAAAGADQ
ncbi:hypothetical protein GCM10009539_19720 [Cryptosporangium japonicum]|uniref:Uncharacterized protein n=1 Tax=Cryptosporangium japonicum TaxID=80872 RepID=A0ABP3DNU3_9ACTN